MSLLKAALREKHFVCVMEFVPKPSAERFAAMEAIMARGQLCGWPMTVAIGDRVGSPLDMSPLDALSSFNTPLPALPHFSGKDRERQHLLAQLQRMDAAGLDQLLLLTGDRLPGHQPGERPVRYLESVAALLIARQACPNWLLGAALNPFKYHEEEGGAQYFKAEKKLAAGADFLTLQLGFDASKHQEAIHWMQRQASPKPMLACLMSLTHGRATMLEHVAGVTVTPSMRDMLEAESKVSKAFAQARSVDRLALQIIGIELMGYAGVHLSGIHELKQLLALEERLQHWQAQIRTLEHWAPAWADSWQMPGLPIVTFHPPQSNWRQCLRQRESPLPPAAHRPFVAVQPQQLAEQGVRVGRAPATLGNSRRSACTARTGTGGQTPLAWLRHLRPLPPGRHPLHLPGNLPQRPGQRPLRWHGAEPLRVWRPRVHP